jgi:signal transduction histidine kinase
MSYRTRLLFTRPRTWLRGLWTWHVGRNSPIYYVFAAGGTLVLTGLQVPFGVLEAPLFPLYFWTLLVTSLCGFGPGVIAAIMSSMLGNIFLLAPVGDWSLAGNAGALTALFTVMTILSVVMMASLQRYALVQKRLLNQEQKIAQQNEALAAALQSAVRARDEFLAVAGHELKTPVTALYLQAQAWQRRLIRAEQTGERRPTVEAWNRQVKGLERLTGLIDELLDVSGINRGKLELNREQLDLREVVEEVISRYTDVLADSKSNVTVHTPESVWGHYDRMRVEQVLSNLLTNALKYGEGQPVHIDLRKEKDQAVVCVQDQGRGIAPEDQHRIFECFERAEPEPSTTGFGVGLWIVRQIVDATGGSIDVDSTLGKGSAFTVRMPLGDAPEHRQSN